MDNRFHDLEFVSLGGSAILNADWMENAPPQELMSTTVNESTVQPGAFEQDANDVLVSLRTALKGIIASLGIERAIDLQRRLQLRSTLSWKIFRLATEPNVLSLGGSVPSRASVMQFLDASSKMGVSASRTRAVLAAYDEFKQLISRHAGDRGSFNLLVSAVKPSSDDGFATVLHHRRNAFRSMSHILGAQCRARATCAIIAKSSGGQKDPYHIAYVSGFAGLRMFRAHEQFRVFGVNIVKGNSSESFTEVQPLDVGKSMHGYCLDDFCSQPLPRMEMTTRNDDSTQSLDAVLVRPDIGNLGVADVYFGGHHFQGSVKLFNLAVTVPTESLLLDLMVEPGIAVERPPKMSFTLGAIQSQTTGATPIEFAPCKVEYLGKGPDALVSADVNRYTEMVSAAGQTLSRSLQEFDVWRLHLRYPLFGANVHLEL